MFAFWYVLDSILVSGSVLTSRSDFSFTRNEKYRSFRCDQITEAGIKSFRTCKSQKEWILLLSTLGFGGRRLEPDLVIMFTLLGVFPIT